MGKRLWLASALSLIACTPNDELDPGNTGCHGDGCAAGPCAQDNGGCDPNATCTASGESRSCTCKDGYTGNGLSCVDANGCGDGQDEDGDGVCTDVDCDDSVDSGGTCSSGCLVVYRDADGDGFGAPASARQTCIVPGGFVSVAGDCADLAAADPACGDDAGAACHPGAREDCDGVDNDCSAATLDGAGDPELGDACDGDDVDTCLNDALQCLAGALACITHTGSDTEPEVCGDERDNDCDGAVDCVDADCGGQSCDDGNGCTHSDVCGGGTCAGTAYSCDDGRSCTADSCDGDGGCSSTLTEGFCLVGGTCFANGAQDPASSCRWCNVGTDTAGFSNRTGGCDDGLACTRSDTCSAGSCNGVGFSCDDGKDCTSNVCDGNGGCSYPVVVGRCLIGTSCYDDGDLGSSTGCTVCDADASQTSWTNTTGSCLGSGDLNACTHSDQCVAGACSGTAYSCPDDGLACTSNVCDGYGGCGGINAGFCVVGNACYASGATNPQNPCERCAPSTSQEDFTAVADGTACTAGGSCQGGECIADACATNNGGCGDPTVFTCQSAPGGGATCGCNAALLNNGPSADESGTAQFLYCLTLARAADPGGQAYYAGELSTFRMSRREILRILLLSPEFAGQAGDALDRLYQRLLGRLPSSEERSAASGEPFGEVVDGVMALAEFFQAQPAALFGACSADKLGRLVNSAYDASHFLADDCLAWAPPGGTVALPPGTYRIQRLLRMSLTRDIAFGSQGVTFKTAGTATSRCPFPAAGQCAELKGWDSYDPLWDWDGDGIGNMGGLAATIKAPKLTIDRIVFNGDKETLIGTPHNAGNLIYTASWGDITAPFYADYLTITRSVLRGNIRGTAFGVDNNSYLTFRDNLVAENGWHWASGGVSHWSDGMTVGMSVGTVVEDNTFADNTDVQLIFGGCIGCSVKRNYIHNTGNSQAPRAGGPAPSAMDGVSWAGLAVQSWPEPVADYRHGNYIGAEFSENQIECGSSTRRCGFGILVGNAAWAGMGILADETKVRSFGARIHHNTVNGAILGIEIDHVSGPYNAALTAASQTWVWANTVTNSGGRFEYCYNEGPPTPACVYLWNEAINVSPGSRPYLRGENGAAVLDFEHTSITYRAVLPTGPGGDLLDGATVLSFSSVPNSASSNAEDLTDGTVGNTGRATTNTARVRLLYRLFLGRDADSSGLTWHLGHLDAGGSIATCARELIDSSEFNCYPGVPGCVPRHGGLGNADFVSVMYMLAYGRVADHGGLTFWTSQLDSGGISRSDFIWAILGSAEFTQRF